MSNASAMSARPGIVVIGRNEGDRLLACLRSLASLACPVVYVDSGSTDGSLERAAALCERAIALDPGAAVLGRPGAQRRISALLAARPELRLIQFLDGDCTLLPGWLEAAAEAMAANPARAVVVGPLRERHPEASDYNRLCALEWRSTPGDLTNFGALGGIMLVRADVFVEVGGFNEQVIAGEDSEFGVRVALAGFKVTKIGVEMATHDADIHRFGQWWRRAVRGGHAIGQRFSLHGRGAMRDCARERRSVLVWGLALPATILVLAPATHGLSLLLAGGYGVLGQRIARYRRGQGDSGADARLYARFVVIGKFAEAWGLLKFYINNMAGRFRIIEYK